MSLEDTKSQLTAVAAMIEEYRQAKGWPIAELMRRHGSGGLGSDKTFNKILNKDFSQMDVEKQLTNYRSVLNTLQDAQHEDGPEPVFGDLSGPIEVRKGLVRAMNTNTVARVGVIEGESGTGKSSCLAVVSLAYGKRIVETEARAAWRDSPSAFLGQILLDLREEPGSSNAAARQTKVERVLIATRRCLVIEEAHHLGPRCLDVLKSLINRTRTEAVLAAIPTLLKRLERSAFEESLQLFRNRLAFRVILKMRPHDVGLLLDRRLPAPMASAEERDKAVQLLCVNGPKHGYHALVREVCRRLRETWADEALGAQPVTLKDLTAAAQAEVTSRGA